MVVYVTGGYDKGVSLLRNHHNGDMAKVAADIFAHYYIHGRNSLAVKLIVSTCTCVGRELCVGSSSLSFPPPSLPPFCLPSSLLPSPSLPLSPSFFLPPPSSPSSPLQNALKSEEAYNMSENLKLILSQLASLSYHKNSKVALAARQVGVVTVTIEIM